MMCNKPFDPIPGHAIQIDFQKHGSPSNMQQTFYSLSQMGCFCKSVPTTGGIKRCGVEDFLSHSYF